MTVVHVAIAGHVDLHGYTAAVTYTAIRRTLRTLTPRAAPLVAVTCLAEGADQVGALAVLDHGGSLEVVVPAQGYRDSLPVHAQGAYDQLLRQAGLIHRLDNHTLTPKAYVDAMHAILNGTDHLIAVWDGRPGNGPGGTGHIVETARARRILVTRIWPRGAQRCDRVPG